MSFETVTQYLERVSDVNLIKDAETLRVVNHCFINGAKAKQRQNLALFEYQGAILDILARSNGMTKTAVLRTILNEWIKREVGETA